MTKAKIIQLIQEDAWRMSILKAVRSLKLQDWLIGAGFVRNPVWDYLHHHKHQTAIADIDVAYFDKTDISIDSENIYAKKLRMIMDVNWSVTNQARMSAIDNQDRDYYSTEDAIAHWPDTASAIGVRLTYNNHLQLISPHGIVDLISLKVRMTPNYGHGRNAFLHRVEQKRWLEKWPNLYIVK